VGRKSVSPAFLNKSLVDDVVPRPPHESSLATRQNIYRTPNVSSLRFGCFQPGKITQYLLLATGNQLVPCLSGTSILVERITEPRGHRVCRAAPVFVVKLQLDNYGISHLCVRRLSDIAMQVKVKTPITNRHQIDTPWLFRLAIHADANWKRFAPVLSKARRPRRADQHIGIDLINLNQRVKLQAAHGPAN